MTGCKSAGASVADDLVGLSHIPMKLAILKDLWLKTKQLLKEHHSPEEIALGIAIGVFIGFTPFYGFHTVLAILAALLVRHANRLAILLGTQISLPFIAPLIYWAEYKVGKILLRSSLFIPQEGREKMLEANHVELGLLAILVGSVVLGLLFCAIAYIVTILVAKKIKSQDGLQPLKNKFRKRFFPNRRPYQPPHRPDHHDHLPHPPQHPGHP